MAKIAIDKQKVGGICRDVMRSLQGSGAHPVEIMLGLAEAIGRVVSQTDATDMAKMDMINISIQHIGDTLEAHKRYVEAVGGRH